MAPKTHLPRRATQRELTSTGATTPSQDPVAGEAAMTRLLADLRAGAAWEAAFDAYRLRTDMPEPPHFSDRRINWNWLTDLDRAGRAIDLGSPFGDFATDLALEFPDVRYVGAAGVHGRVVAERMVSSGGRVRTELSSAPLTSTPVGTADLAVFVASNGWQDRIPPWARAPSGLPGVLADHLRPGGWLALLLSNPFWYQRLSMGIDGVRGAVGDLRMLRAIRDGLRRVEVAEVREYLTAPLLDVPQVIVPRRRSAVLAYCGAAHIHVRRLRLARAGLHAALFPGILVLART